MQRAQAAEEEQSRLREVAEAGNDFLQEVLAQASSQWQANSGFKPDPTLTVREALERADVPIAAQSGVVAIAAGDFHHMALKDDGSVVAWGNNDDGQTRVPAAAKIDVVAIAAGRKHSLALKSDGSVVAWGRNLRGETNVPAGLPPAFSLSAGNSYSSALVLDPALH